MKNKNLILLMITGLKPAIYLLNSNPRLKRRGNSVNYPVLQHGDKWNIKKIWGFPEGPKDSFGGCLRRNPNAIKE